MQYDRGFRLLLTNLVLQLCRDAGDEVPLPPNLRVRQVSDEDFKADRDALQGCELGQPMATLDLARIQTRDKARSRALRARRRADMARKRRRVEGPTTTADATFTAGGVGAEM